MTIFSSFVPIVMLVYHSVLAAPFQGEKLSYAKSVERVAPTSSHPTAVSSVITVLVFFPERTVT